LVQPPEFVVQQLRQLARSLHLPLDRAWALACGCPGVLWLTQAQLYERIRALCSALCLPAHATRQAVAVGPSLAAPLLLLLQPVAIRAAPPEVVRELRQAAAGGM
jgi:hypothetical protein